MMQNELIPVEFPKEAYRVGERSDGEIHGVVLTKPHIVDLILDLSGYTPDKKLFEQRLLEPSCGHGAFLIPAIERLLKSANGKDLTAHQLRGSVLSFDIDGEHVQHTRDAVVRTLLRHGFSGGDADALAESWVREADFLLAPLPTAFDYIIGNPPYIRIEQIAQQLQAEYRRRFTSLFDRADLYVAFIERSLTSLSDKGVLSFICADRWILNRYGAPLRKKIASEYQVRAYIDLHTASPFDSDVIAYPSIFVIGRGKTTNVKVATLRTADRGECLNIIPALGGDDEAARVSSMAVYDSWFSGDEPWTLSSPEQLRILRHLEQRYRAIEDDESTQVRIGVATGQDKVFIVDEGVDIESDRLLPLVMRSDLDQGKIHDARRYVINTFDNNGKLVNLQMYPRLKTYFDHHEETIRKRHVAKKNAPGWFRTIDRVYPELVQKPKLLIPDIAGSNEVTYDPGHYFPHHNLYYVISDIWDLEVLGGLLSSRVALFFVWSYAVKMRGGYLRFQAQYLRRIRLPDPCQLPEAVKDELKNAFRSRNFRKIDEAAMRAYGIEDLPLFDFVDTRK
jgi:hypothetical protein